jgi:hypothetical protein
MRMQVKISTHGQFDYLCGYIAAMKFMPCRAARYIVCTPYVRSFAFAYSAKGVSAVELECFVDRTA